MVVCVQRSKTLPFGGRLGGDELDRVREQVRLAAPFASVAHHVTFDAHARERWIAAYEVWSLARERHDGITRTEVSNLFSRSKRPARSTARCKH